MLVSIPVTVKGYPGGIQYSDGHVAFEGCWASHTGYHSLYTGGAYDSLEEAAQDPELRTLAETYVTEAEALPFLVGKEHQDNGWKMVKLCPIHNRVVIRLPQWERGIVSGALEQSLGMELVEPHNSRWAFPASMTEQQVREIMAPLMKDHTRLVDENELLCRLLKSEGYLAYLATQNQFDLFG